MTTKQMLFSALILGTTTNIALGMDRLQQPEYYNAEFLMNKQQIQQEYYNDAFLRAAREGKPELMQEYRKKGVDINVKDKRFSETALHKIAHAAIVTEEKNQNYLKIMSELIKDGVDPDAQNKLGDSAAHFAALGCNDEMLRLMHEKNVKLTIKNNKGKTPLDQVRLSFANHFPAYVPHCTRAIAFLEEIEKAQGEQKN